MGLQHKFGVAFLQFGLGLTTLTPIISHALTLDPVNIDSSRGEPLYAEIPFRQAQSKKSINVSIAQPFESGEVAVLNEAEYAHYNFYVRQNADGNGAIVITSSRAINSNVIDLTLKIEDAGQTRIQQIRGSLPSRIDRLKSSLNETVLKPRYVTNDQDLKLNLPEVSNFPEENQLRVANVAPPMMQKQTVPEPVKSPVKSIGLATSNNATPPVVSAPIQQVARQTTSSTAVAKQNTQVSQQQTPSQTATTKPNNTNTVASSPKGELNINVTRRDASQPVTKAEPVKTAKNVSSVAQQSTAKVTASSKTTTQPKPVAEKAKVKATSVKKVQKQTPPRNANAQEKHKVQANESLWGIANQIAKQESVPIQQVMKQIQENNKHAFINGNANQLKQGAILSLNYQYQAPTEKPKVTTQSTPPKKPEATTASTASPAAKKAEKQSQAHMSIVAGDSRGTTQGSKKAKGIDKKVSNELTVRVKQARQSALGLQNNVRQLDRDLVAKENRIALLNARLAELEQQLKKRQASETKPSEKTKPNVTSQAHPRAELPNKGQYQALSNIHQYKMSMQQGLV